MAKKKYLIGTVKPLYVTTFECAGMTFHIHRPVDGEMKRLKEGWQVSYKGVPVQDYPDKAQKVSAVSQFHRTLKEWKCSNERFQRVVEDAVVENAAELGI